MTEKRHFAYNFAKQLLCDAHKMAQQSHELASADLMA
jgi:hypothetical protein